MTWLNAYLPAPGAAIVWEAVQAVADQLASPGPSPRAAAHPRPAPRRRPGRDRPSRARPSADRRPADRGTAPNPRSRSPSPSPRCWVSIAQPGELDGYGPIPAELATRLAADPTGTWRRLVTDPHGQLLDYGRTTYRPPQDLADHVITRDQRCRMPGCHRTARRSHLDHITDWNAGGTTSPREPAPTVRTRPHHQTHRRLARPTPPRRHHHLDHTHRPPLHQTPRHPPHRPHPRPTLTARSTRTRRRSDDRARYSRGDRRARFEVCGTSHVAALVRARLPRHGRRSRHH